MWQLRADPEAMRQHNFVQFEGSYGGDVTHALAAWTSTKRELTEEREQRIDKLLKQLAENEPPHSSPFEKSFIHYVVDVETASHIHILKHRVGVSVNGESARYKEHKEDRYYIPLDWPEGERRRLDLWCRHSFNLYHETLQRLVTEGFSRKRAKESARFYLPYASSLRLDVNFNFSSFMHFFKLRHDKDAQEEIQFVSGEMLRLLVSNTYDFDHSLRAFGIEPEGYRK